MRLTHTETDLLFNQYEGYYGAKNGCDVVTTIDMSIQHYVEKTLNQAVKDYDIKNGAGAIVMDVNTGKILAMASLGGYDLNNFLDVSDEAKSVIDKASTEEEKNQLLADAQRLQWRNKTLSDTYEPGSTFKIITLSMALEEGVVSLNDSFGCGGSVQVQGRNCSGALLENHRSRRSNAHAGRAAFVQCRLCQHRNACRSGKVL